MTPRVQPRTPSRWLGFTGRQHAAALAIFAGVTLAFFFPLLRGETLANIDGRQRVIYPWAALDTGADEQIIHDDIAEHFYPLHVFMSRAYRDGEVPLWDPHSFGGYPLHGSGITGTLYPLRVVLYPFLSPVRARDLLIVTHFFLAGVAMFALLGVVRLPFSAALVGALAWMTNSYALAWQYLESYVSIEVWLPIGVLLAHLAVRRRSWPAAFALALAAGVMFHGAFVLFVALAALVIFGYGITLAVVDAIRDRTSLAGNAARLGAAAVLFGGLAAVTSLPTLALAADTARVPPTYDELVQGALEVSALAHIFYPPEYWLIEPYHQNLFAGTAVGVLAVIGIGRRNALAAFAAALGALTILYMVHTPVTAVVVEVLPGMDQFKPFARAAFLVQFALAVLAGFGLATVLEILKRARVRGSAVRVVAPAVVALVAASVVLQAYRVSETLIEYQPNEDRLLLPATPLIRHLERRPDGRVLGAGETPEPPKRTTPALPGLTGMAHGLDTAGGYHTSPPTRTYYFWRLVTTGQTREQVAARKLTAAFYHRYEFDRLRSELLARTGVRYVVTPPGVAAPGPPPDGLERSYEGPDGDVFTVRDAVPRAYLVGSCAEVADADTALERFVSGEVDTRGTVLLESEHERPASHDCDGRPRRGVGIATVVDRSLNTLDVRVRADREAWLVVTDTWDPGWSATVDGDDADVLPGNYAQRAVAVPAGEHVVRLTYRPVHFRAGAAVSGVSLVVTLGGLGWLALRRRTSRRARPPTPPG